MKNERQNRLHQILLDLNVGKKLMLTFFLITQLAVIGLSLWSSAWLYCRLAPKTHSTGTWVLLVLLCFIVFSYVYLIILLILRILIPKPKEGFFPARAENKPPAEAVLFMFNVLLVMLRSNPPWSIMVSGILVNIPPLALIFRYFFGPHSKSMTMGDTIRLFDPYLVYVGRNVQLGFGLAITCHIFDNRGLLIKRVVIEDGAVVGGNVWLHPGVQVGHHAVVAFSSIVLPNTIIKPWEFWGGHPAKKIKDIPHVDSDTQVNPDELLI